MNRSPDILTAGITQVLYQMRIRGMLAVSLVAKVRQSAQMFKQEKIPLEVPLTGAQATRNVAIFLGISEEETARQIENGELRLYRSLYNHTATITDNDLLYQLAVSINLCNKAGRVRIMDKDRYDVHQAVEELMYTVNSKLQDEVVKSLGRGDNGRLVLVRKNPERLI